MNYLVVVAHPDDEVLGAGATIHKLISEGHNVAVAIMVSQAAARKGLSSTLSDDEAKARRITDDYEKARYSNGEVSEEDISFLKNFK